MGNTMKAQVVAEDFEHAKDVLANYSWDIKAALNAVVNREERAYLLHMGEEVSEADKIYFAECLRKGMIDGGYGTL